MAEMLQMLEGAALLAIQSMRQDMLDALLVFYTTLGNAGLLWILISAGLVLYKPTRRAGLTALLALALGFLCTNVALKHLVGRERPWLNVPGLVPLVAEHDPNSFPSGHTCAAFAAGVAWAMGTDRRWLRVLCVGAAVCMGFSRLYVGVHYPSDVIAGALVGTLCAWLALRLTERIPFGNKIK